jgi:mRNA-degrading endonuclease RelE of RelBE toxin-antitoxin system
MEPLLPKPNETDSPPWTVKFTGKARKQKDKLPQNMAAALLALKGELEWEGPEQPEWHHYGKLKGKKDVHHCHLNKGKPRYVVVWQVTDRTVQVMEIRYVGTHENADYRRIG